MHEPFSNGYPGPPLKLPHRPQALIHYSCLLSTRFAGPCSLGVPLLIHRNLPIAMLVLWVGAIGDGGLRK